MNRILQWIGMAIIIAVFAACSGSNDNDENVALLAPTVELAAGDVATTLLTFTISPQHATRCAYVCIPKGETEPSVQGVLSEGENINTQKVSTVTVDGLKAGTVYVILVAVENEKGTALQRLEMATAQEVVSDKSHTLLFYFMGNETGLTEDMDKNIQKVVTTAIEKQLINDRQHIAIFYDRGDFTRLTKIGKDAEGRTKQLTIQEYNKNVSCVTSEFIADVVAKVKKELPADSYGLVISSHGGGWVPSDVYDRHTAPTRFVGQDGKDWLEIPQLVEGLKGTHFDYICFDECFMASVEALYDLRTTTDHVVASPIEVLSAGFPYPTILPQLFTPDHGLIEVCKAFMAFYRNSSNAIAGIHSGAVSLIDCSKLDALAAVMKQVLALGGSKQPALADIQGYEGFAPHLYFDFEQYVEQLIGTSGATYDAFNAALKATVVYEDHTEKFYSAFGPNKGVISLSRSCGLNCHVNDPTRPGTHEAFLKTDWAKAIGAR